MPLFEGTAPTFTLSFRLEHQASPQFSPPDSHILLRILGDHVQGLSRIWHSSPHNTTVSLALSSVAAPFSLGEPSRSLCFLWQSVEAALAPPYANRSLDFPCRLNSGNLPPLCALPCTVTLCFLCGGRWPQGSCTGSSSACDAAAQSCRCSGQVSLALHSVLSSSSSSSHIPCSMFP